MKNLKDKDPALFIQTKKLAGDSIKKFNFLTSKGVFPYEYVTSEEKQNSIPKVGHDELAERNFVSMFCISNFTFFPTL